MRPPTTTTSAACSAILVHCCLLRTGNCSIFAIGRRRRPQPAWLTYWPPASQTSFSPQPVEPARNLQWRALTDVALEDFAVIADRLDDAGRPIIGQAERLPELALDAEQTPHIRRVGLHHVVDIFLGNAELFRI